MGARARAPDLEETAELGMPPNALADFEASPFLRSMRTSPNTTANRNPGAPV